jgi:hypothetical protein
MPNKVSITYSYFYEDGKKKRLVLIAVEIED